MKIRRTTIDVKPRPKFSELIGGEVFVHASTGDLYMKVSRLLDDGYNAVSLAAGLPVAFNDSDNIQRVDAELVVKE